MQMTPDDFQKLLQWQYANADGERWLGAASHDLRINARNLRGMMAGKVAIPPAVAHILCVLVAAHSRLLGWSDHAHRLYDLQLGDTVLNEIGRWRADIDRREMGRWP